MQSHNYSYVPSLVLTSALHALSYLTFIRIMVGWAPLLQFCARVNRGRRRLIDLDTEQSKELSWGGCDSQAPALCSLPYSSSQSGFRKLCLAEAACYTFCTGPGPWTSGILVCCFPSDMTRCVFLPP